MKLNINMISKRTKIAANTIIIFSVIGIFIAIMGIFGVIPSNMVWGGRVINDNQLIFLESVSITVNILIIWFVAMRAEYVPKRVSRQMLNTVLVVFMAMMIMNTIGNITAKTIFEQLMSVVTFVSAFCFYILVKNQE